MPLCWLCIEEEEGKLTVYERGHKIQLYYLCGYTVLYLKKKKIKGKYYSKVMTLRSLGDSEVPHTTIK